MDPASFLKIITNSTFMVTQLFGRDPVQFSQQQYNVTVSEDTSPGPLLILRAITSPPGEPVHYSLLDGPRKGAAKWFRIDSTAGLLRLVKPLDFEQNKQHLFRVSAGTGRGSGETAVLVRVKDVNDHAPVFLRRHYETQITEEDDRHLPKPVLQVEAVDEDAGRWGVVRYSIEGDGIVDDIVAPADDYFEQDYYNKANLTSEEITVDEPSDTKTLLALFNFERDFSEGMKNYNKIPHENKHFQPKTKDSVSSFHYSYGKRFPNTSIINSLLQTNSSSVLRSSFHKSLQKYYRGNSTLHTPAFTVDPVTGTVYVMKPLDRDGPSGRARWTLRVKASDGQLEAVTAVQINLKDVNDNAPRFPAAIVRAAVPENAPAGTPVVTVAAHDPDDPAEANNARLVYSLQKNVIDESSGRPIFTVDSETGSISTALCCLDREHTGRYGLLLAATDGSGLQGTCTVTVEVRDVNDVPPRWALSEWLLQVPEGQPPHTVIATLPVTDPDRANTLAYRVVPASGKGWELVEVEGRPEGGGAQLKARIPLDYEDPNHRTGISFQVQVTDQGEGTWNDQYRAGVASISLQVSDTNDNSPVFESSSRDQSLELSEASLTGTVLTTLVATDQDEGSGGLISYGISPPSDPGGIFAVDTGGTIRLARTLDREKMTEHVLHVLAWDSGDPPNTATATLTISVTDINDNAPSLSSPRVLGLPALDFQQPIRTEVTFNLTLDDPDDWAAGNGPPFSLTVDPDTEDSLSSFLKLKYKPGRVTADGGVVVPLTATVTREMGGVLAVPLLVRDSGSPQQSATVTVTLARSSGPQSLTKEHKFVSVASVKSTGGIGLGRVRDVGGNGGRLPVGARYTWLRAHPLFSLNAHTGALTVAADAPTGTYDVQVSVSDVTATNVEVSVTVDLYHVTRRDVTMATPIDVSTVPADLVFINEDGQSLLQRLLKSLDLWAEESRSPELRKGYWNVNTVSIQEVFREDGVTPATRVWLAASLDLSPSLEMLIHRSKEKIVETLGINVISVGVGVIGLCSKNLGGCKCCCQDKVLVGENYILVDSSTSAHVGPTIHILPFCGCSGEKGKPKSNHVTDTESPPLHPTSDGKLPPVAGDKGDSSVAPAAHAVVGEEPPSCQHETCLNGGRCIPQDDQRPKCICPTHTYGPRCKIIYREFNRHRSLINSRSLGSWAWLPSLPACSHLHITLHLLTRNIHGLLLYTSDTNQASYNPFLALQVANGRPQLILRLGNSGTISTITLNSTINDNRWHRLDFLWRSQTVELISDLCSMQEELSSPSNDSDHAITGSSQRCRESLQLHSRPSSFGWGTPIQLGGRADSGGTVALHSPPIVSSFSGCISKLIINGKMQDLGPTLLSSGSSPGCSDISCLRLRNSCPLHSRCRGSPGHETCECLPGHSGTDCTSSSAAVSFKPNSFVQLALSFTPPPYSTNLQLRVRTREASGQLIALTSRHGRDSLTLTLVDGKPCMQLSLHPEAPVKLCLKAALNDGHWHSITANRQGSSLEMTADDGEEALYRAALWTEQHTTMLYLHRQEGVVIGGRPEYRRTSHTTVHHDFFNGCLDDIRLEGRPLPLDPSHNGTTAGAVSVARNVSPGCLAPPMCINVTCRRPFSCQDTWRQNYCGCDVGYQVSRDGSQCADTDECVWSPCLNSGTCYNLRPGYSCDCSFGYSGSNCEHGQPVTGVLTGYSILFLTTGVLAATLLAVSAVLFVAWYCYKRRDARRSSHIKESKTAQTSVNLSFDNLHLQNSSIQSSELLSKLQSSRTKKSESVSVISLTTTGCDVHLNEFLNTESRIKLSSKQLVKDAVVRKVDPHCISSGLGRSVVCSQTKPAMDCGLPCTCGSGAEATPSAFTDVDVLHIPSPQMFADPLPCTGTRDRGTDKGYKDRCPDTLCGSGSGTRTRQSFDGTVPDVNCS